MMRVKWSMARTGNRIFMEYLYLLIIKPIEYLIELIFVLLHRFLGNPGEALLGVSIAVSFLVLPLYLRADRVQEDAIAKQKSMEAWTKHIKRHFSGDDRYMTLSAYYRSCGYHPLHILCGTLSVLLQIPFFLAAYNYLSSLETLQGVSFGPINDLGAPDALVYIGGLSINILPVLMTLINMVSGTIYTKGGTLREKIQVYLPALVFLVLLYNSPSGLVMYWTMNNLFSLSKNVVLKYVKDKGLFLSVLFAVMGIVYLIFLVDGRCTAALSSGDYELLAVYILVALIFFLPIAIPLLKKKLLAGIIDRAKALPQAVSVKYVDYLLLALVLTFFMGLIIPLSVVSSSPQDFVDVFAYINPLHYVLTTSLTMFGCFVLWGSLLFLMLDEKVRIKYYAVLSSLLIVGVINFYFTVADMGVCEMQLLFEREPHFDKLVRYGNAVLVVIIFSIFFVLNCYAHRIRRYFIVVLLAVFCVIGVSRITATEKELGKMDLSVDYSAQNIDFPLSRSGKNVVVIMLDKAIGGYIPFIMEERPDLLAKMDGFTFYPNTVSTGTYTKYGSPAIFGGYDYTSYAIDSRPDETLVKKHDEALHVMPALFDANGYRVTLADLPYAGYTYVPTMSIFDDLPNVNAFNYSARYSGGEDAEFNRRLIEHNFFLYSFLRTVPAMLQDDIYDHSNYLADRGDRTWFSDEFRKEYKALVSMSEHTSIVDDAEGSLILYCNCVSHEAWTFPQLPDYTMEDHVDNSGYPFETYREIDGITLDLDDANTPFDAEWALYSAQYAVTASALLRLADWLDYLREEGVYDNTRIILVADHGRALGQFAHMDLGNGIDVEAYNALLMEKDFYSHGYHTDDSFMTNADVPAMAMEGIIDNPVNPYNGNAVDMSGKENGVYIYSGSELDIPAENHTLSNGNNSWLHVNDYIFDVNNWSITPE